MPGEPTSCYLNRDAGLSVLQQQWQQRSSGRLVGVNHPRNKFEKKICPSAVAAASHLVIITIIFIISRPLPLTHPSYFFPSISAHSAVQVLKYLHLHQCCRTSTVLTYAFVCLFFGGLFFNPCRPPAQLLRWSGGKIHDSRPADRLEA